MHAAESCSPLAFMARLEPLFARCIILGSQCFSDAVGEKEPQSKMGH